MISQVQSTNQYTDRTLSDEALIRKVSQIQTRLNVRQTIRALQEEGKRSRAKSRQESSTKRIGTISEMLKTVANNIG